MSFPLSASKYWLRRSEAWLLSRFAADQGGSRLRSASDAGRYPDLALRAALDARTFSVFRRHPDYTPILEHVSPELGAAYLSIILGTYGLSAAEVCELIAPLQTIGSPRRYRLHGLPSPVSTTAIRYLKVGLDLVHLFGSHLGHVVEIGCGYGGQAVILSQLAQLDSYTFIDLWQVNLLIRRFMESSGSSFPYETSTLRDLSRSRVDWDLVISNYAFSELPLTLQTQYHERILAHCRRGYLTMNSGPQGAFGSIRNLSQGALMDLLPASSCQPERPQTMPGNYLLTWGSCLQPLQG